MSKIGLHDHLCLIYETQEEQFAAAIPFMQIGLERGEKCLYIADDNTADAVLEAMRAQGIDVDAAVTSGALAVVSKREAYLRRGYFDPDWMIRFLSEATAAAKAEGFAAFRATGEMTWMLGGNPGSERLMEYEAKLNYFFPTHDVTAICQYNRNRFSSEVILDVIRTHPIVIYGGMVCKNFYYVPPDEFLRPNQIRLEVQRLLYSIRDRQRVEDSRQASWEALHFQVEELEKAEEALRHNEQLLRLVLDTLPVGVWITDRQGQILMGNPAAQQIWEGARYVGINHYGEYKGWWADTGKRIEAEE